MTPAEVSRDRDRTTRTARSVCLKSEMFRPSMVCGRHGTRTGLHFAYAPPHGLMPSGASDGQLSRIFVMPHPKISVLLPAYNAGKYLVSAIESVLNQTEPNFELIAVDDGSKDDTPHLLRSLAKRDPRIKVISRANTGIVGALNDALDASQAPLIARMDGDDWCHPRRFARQLAHMNDNPDVVLLGTNVMVMDSDGDDVAPLRDLKLTHEEIDRSLMSCGWPLVHPTVMIRREALLSVGAYRQGTFPHEDHDLFLRLTEVGKAAALEDILLRYRRHSTSVSWDSNSRDHMIGIIREAAARRGVEADIPPLHSTDEPTGNAGARQLRAWAWQALRAGNRHTARKYAFRTVRSGLIEGETLKLLACCVRGR